MDARRAAAICLTRVLESLEPLTADTSPSDRRDTSTDRELELVERLAGWMDRRYVDPILGLLIPGAGDVLGAVVGLFGIVVALRLRAHPIVIARMLLNLAFDALMGAIPFLGDLFDVVYRAQTRNLALLRQRGSRAARASDWLVVFAAGLVFLVALSLPIVLGAALIRALS